MTQSAFNKSIAMEKDNRLERMAGKMHLSVKQDNTLLEQSRKARRKRLGNSALVPADVIDVKRHNEISKIIFDGSAPTRPYDCPEVFSESASRRELALRYTGKDLNEVVKVFCKSARETLGKEKSTKQIARYVSENIDAELHRLGHLHRLSRAERTGETVEQRFKAWLDVKAGAQHNLIAARLRKARPNELLAGIDSAAEKLMEANEKQKKASYENFVSDDKMTRLLLSHALEYSDIEALDLYTELKIRHIKQNSPVEQHAALTMDLHRALWAHRKKTKDERKLAEQVSRSRATDTREVKHRAAAMHQTHADPSGDVRIYSASDFVNMYNTDSTLSQDELLQEHCGALAMKLSRTIDACANLVDCGAEGRRVRQGRAAAHWPSSDRHAHAIETIGRRGCTCRHDDELSGAMASPARRVEGRHRSCAGEKAQAGRTGRAQQNAVGVLRQWASRV